MQRLKILKTGTTTVGIKYKDGVVLAAESKSTLGYLVASKTAEKVIKIDDRLAITTAGGSGDTQALARILKAEINLYKLSRNTDITVKATITLLANIMQSARYYPYMAMLILGGYDKDGGHIYIIDSVGGMEVETYTSTGSRWPVAFVVLENDFREDMLEEEAVRLAVRSIRSARERDIFSGGRDIVVVTIDKNGVEFVSKDKVRDLAK